MHPFRYLDSIRLSGGMLWFACFCFCSQHVSAEDKLSFDPYPVYVVQENAYARCGPSNEFYRTDPLRHGQELEVYAETDDGWLGIRPPEDSFCWVPAETVELDASDETGTIIEDRTVSWIGTHLGRARTYRWQVQLAQGEPVTVIGKSEREGADGPQLWYRIVPPSGEYRWVHRDQIVTSSEELVASVRRQSEKQRAESVARAKKDKKDTDKTGPEPTQTASAQPSGDKTTSARRRRDTSRPSGEQLAESSGQSVLQSPAMVGSGLSKAWQTTDGRRLSGEQRRNVDDVAQAGNATATDTNTQSGAFASVEFLSRPRLLEIGSRPAAPQAGETAGDDNWVVGAARSTTLPTTASVAAAVASAHGAAGSRPQALLQSPNPVRQVSGQMPNVAPQGSPAVAQAVQTLQVVSAERIAQIEAETRGADTEKLSLIFSRLMASRASAAEVEPLAHAAGRLASTSPDPLAAGRARLLAERVDQYRHVATRRDGAAVIRSTSTSPISSGQQMPVPSTPVVPAVGTASGVGATGVEAVSQSGYLVQVYSARSNSPPFALTDDTGRTIAYVTPARGVNLRTHLNSKISVSGTQGFLTGLNTPHILVTRAVRTPE